MLPHGKMLQWETPGEFHECTMLGLHSCCHSLAGLESYCRQRKWPFFFFPQKRIQTQLKHLRSCLLCNNGKPWSRAAKNIHPNGENKHTFELPHKHTPGNQKRAQKKKKKSKKKKKQKHQAKNTKPDNNKVPNPRKNPRKKTDPSSTNDSKLRTSIIYLLLLRFPLVSCNFAFRL
jgi:hypothetical protein